jgi:ABC-type branched-subunit amino acid transport system ATPase component
MLAPASQGANDLPSSVFAKPSPGRLAWAGAVQRRFSQRLRLARTLATGAEVILMDEPSSTLDPKIIGAIGELILKLRERLTVVLVTHKHGALLRRKIPAK